MENFTVIKQNYQDVQWEYRLIDTNRKSWFINLADDPFFLCFLKKPFQKIKEREVITSCYTQTNILPW
jgi:hypothetical protein